MGCAVLPYNQDILDALMMRFAYSLNWIQQPESGCLLLKIAEWNLFSIDV